MADFYTTALSYETVFCVTERHEMTGRQHCFHEFRQANRKRCCSNSSFFISTVRRTRMKWNLVLPSLIAAGAITASSLALAAAADLSSCCTPGDKDFPKVGGNLGNQAYS